MWAPVVVVWAPVHYPQCLSNVSQAKLSLEAQIEGLLINVRQLERFERECSDVNITTLIALEVTSSEIAMALAAAEITFGDEDGDQERLRNDGLVEKFEIVRKLSQVGPPSMPPPPGDVITMQQEEDILGGLGVS